MDWLRLLPKYWHQNDLTCRHWDERLNLALDDVEFGDGVLTYDGFAEAGFNELTVWVANFPYAYGYRRRGLSDASGLPKVATRLRLRRLLATQA